MLDTSDRIGRDGSGEVVCSTPEDMFALGESLATGLRAGDVYLLTGGLGAGKTLLTKGILSGLGYDVDEVTSPSFTIVNLYRTSRFEVFHIDLWRLQPDSDLTAAIGLDEILENENAVSIIEWADKLPGYSTPRGAKQIAIDGDGDEPRRVVIRLGAVPHSEKS